MLEIKFDNKVSINMYNNSLIFKGPKGCLSLLILDNTVKMFLNLINSTIIIKSNKKNYLNLYNSLIKQKIKGVLRGYRKTIFIRGVGYKFILDDKNNNFFKLKIGYSHLIDVCIPLNISLLCLKKNSITFFSNDLVELTRFIFLIKNYKKTNPYKLKGLILKGENVKLKEIKKNKK
jgi:large subunit ribosomal protein L6